MISLTGKQKNLLEVAKKRGFISHRDLYREYSSEVSRKDAIRRMCEAGILTPIKGNTRFMYKRKEK